MWRLLETRYEKTPALPYAPLAQATGVYGIGGAGDAPGVLGQGGSAVANGVLGFSASGSGINGQSKSGVGVRAFSSSGTGVVAEGNQLAPGTIGLIATGNLFAAQFNRKVHVNGDLTVSGALHSVSSPLHFGRTRVTMASDATITLSPAQYNTVTRSMPAAVSRPLAISGGEGRVRFAASPSKPISMEDQLQPVAPCRSQSAFLRLIQLPQSKLKGKIRMLIDADSTFYRCSTVIVYRSRPIHVLYETNRRALNEESGDDSR